LRPNIVQSIRAFRVQDLQDAAQTLASTSCTPTWPTPRAKQDVLDMIAQQFTFPRTSARTSTRCTTA
jgi:hypothetical protein